MVKPTSKAIPKPPRHLTAATKRWYSEVVATYDMESHHVRIFTNACESWDRGVEAREALAEHGLTYTDRFGAPHPRPEVAIERDSRIAFARLIRELGLDLAGEPEAPRFPRVGGRR